MLALDMRHLYKRYGAGIRGCSAGVDALRDASLHVRPGEVVGIVGAPGSGKSTLLLCASGAMRPDSGTVTRSGRAATTRSAGCRTAYVADGLVGCSYFTVRELLEHHPALRGVLPDEAGARVQDALGMADLSRWATARFGDVTPGVARRVAIARELLRIPDLLVVDEPFGHLPTAAQGPVADLLRSLAPRGVAVLVASRDGRAIARACTRAIVMSNGRLHGDMDPARFHPAGRVAEVPW